MLFFTSTFVILLLLPNHSIGIFNSTINFRTKIVVANPNCDGTLRSMGGHHPRYLKLLQLMMKIEQS